MRPFLFKELVKEDCYKIIDLAAGPDAGQLRQVLDLGANIGFFSTLARMCFPGARMAAVEPCSRTFKTLRTNVRGLGVDCRQVALGDGSNIVVNEHMNPLRFYASAAGGSAPDGIRSMKLRDLFDTCGFSAELPTLIKIDCEGGEKHMIGDVAAEDLLARSVQFCLEFHYGTHSDGVLPRAAYEEWILNFQQRHPSRSYTCRLEEKSQTGYRFSRALPAAR